MSTSLERELLSAYLDNELPEPWRGRVARAVEQRPEAAAKLDQYDRIKDGLQQDSKRMSPDEQLSEAQQRVWKALQERLPAQAFSANVVSESSGTATHWWQKAVQIPVPVAAAVAAIFIGVAVLLPGAFRGSVEPGPTAQGMAAMPTAGQFVEYSSMPDVMGSGTSGFAGQVSMDSRMPLDLRGDAASDLQLRIEIGSLQQLVDLLATQNVVRDVTITLPAESDFNIFGEPVLMRKSDLGDWRSR